LSKAADLSREVVENFNIFSRGLRPAGDDGQLLGFKLGTTASGEQHYTSQEGPAQRLSLDCLPLPPAFSVITWIKMSQDQPFSLILGFCDANGACFALTTDTRGAPVAILGDSMGLMQVCRAQTGAANLCDNRLHSLVAIVNMDSGLVRLYVDGSPEAACVVSLWRPRVFAQVFAPVGANCFSLIGSEDKLFTPRMIAGELSDVEISKLKPSAEYGSYAGNSPFVLKASDSEFALKLIERTLIEFAPLGTISRISRRILRRPPPSQID
jgi:hypothetical protein